MRNQIHTNKHKTPDEKIIFYKNTFHGHFEKKSASRVQRSIKYIYIKKLLWTP